ncbi:MAG: hypothetical protein OEQ53_11925 [Saprospiraceae bacterium]|nr:hypothetical protein [Saprospiraceae bacterium]
MRNWIMLVFALSIWSLATAQDRELNQQRLQERIESQRIAFITERVHLTPDEAMIFWPLYNEYRDGGRALKAKKKADKLLLDMDDNEATAYLSNLMEVEREELMLKIDYTERLKSVLSPKKILRFYTAERQFKERLVQLMSQRRDRIQDRRKR